MDNNQRKFDRIEIPEAFVNLYIGNDKFHLFPNYSRSFPLINLTKCGLCFKCEKQLRIGQDVEIRISTSQMKSIRLRVRVLWSKLDEMEKYYFTGVRIHPFGSVNGLNSTKSLHRLKELEKTYAEIG